MASRVEDFGRGADNLLNPGNIDSGMVQHAALCPEIILHVNDDHRRPRRIDHDWFGLRSDTDNPTLRAMKRMMRSLSLIDYGSLCHHATHC